MSKKKRLLVVAVLLLVIIVFVSCFCFCRFNGSTVNEYGLNVETGVVDPDGTLHPFSVINPVFNIVSINGEVLDPDCYFYYLFNLRLKASGEISNAKVVEVHYTYSQKLNGVLTGWVAGTESSGDRPLTSSGETWLKVNLPVNQFVNVPLKYRDNFVYPEPSVMRPLSVSSGSYAVREARLDRVGDFEGYAPGTYNLQYICTVHSVVWQYTTAGGQVVTENYVPSPNTLSSTISITVTDEGVIGDPTVDPTPDPTVTPTSPPEAVLTKRITVLDASTSIGLSGVTITRRSSYNPNLYPPEQFTTNTHGYVDVEVYGSWTKGWYWIFEKPGYETKEIWGIPPTGTFMTPT